MKTYEKALNLLSKGHIQKAWDIAKTDPGLRPGVTIKAWITFAFDILSIRRGVEYKIFWK